MTACAKVAVYIADPDDFTRRRAAQLAAQCALPLTEAPDPTYDILLTVTADRLELRFPHRGGPRPLYVDFVAGPLGYARRVARFGLLYQAIGFKSGRPTVLDATAGLGRDAFRLAYHGCQVTAMERSPILFALLQDGLDRANRVPELHEHLGDRLRLLQGDARDVLRQMCGTAAPGCVASAPDVIYLDPMFPPKKKSALVKKEMRILRQLVGDDPDARELFDVARAAARQRVVVKRLTHAEPLAPNPTHAHRDKTTRYDVYLTPRSV
jgi:16S rRNA (guanine1516-N2)-methyltransferase